LRITPLDFFGSDFGGFTRMKAALKLWLDQDGKAFGDGPYELLKRIEATGSLQKAAAQMEMSYSKAWKLMREIEQRLGFPLLDRRVGGQSGGGSQITPRAKELMLCYGKFRKEAKEAIERIYQKQFVSLSKSQERRRT
jgi:molybdate transport system regulatory protein